MSVIRLEKFNGMAPSANPEYIRDDLAVFAKNVDLRFQDLRPMKTPAFVASASAGSTLYKFSGSSTFITKSGDVNFVRGQIPTDATERTYYTGDGAPKVTDLTLAVRQLGVPAPATAPVCTKNVVQSFTVDDALAARDAMPSTLAKLIKAALVWTYKGLPDSDLIDLVAVPTRPWEFDVARPGSSVSGNFVLTNANDLSLMASELEYFTDSTNLYVPLFVRGGVWSVNESTLSAALTALPNADPTVVTPMFSSAQVTSMVSAIQAYFSSRDKEIDAIIPRIKAEKTDFMRLLSNPSSVSSIVSGSIASYYAKSSTVALLNSYVTAAANALVDTANGWTVGKGLTVSAAVTQINTYIVLLSDGTKALNDADMRVWAQGQLTAATEPQDAGLIVSTAGTICDVLANDIRSLVDVSKGFPASGALVTVEAGTAPVTRVMIEKQASLEALVKSIEAISKGLLDNVEKDVAAIFDSKGSANFPTGEQPIISSRAYVVTEVTDWDEESKPSPISNIIELDQNDTATIALPATVGPNTTKKRIYRSSSGSTTAAFLFHSEVPASTASITDTKKSDELNEACPTFGWDLPPADLKGLVGMPNGIMLGFTGNTLHACEPFHPYAWPARYQIPIEYPIVGIVVAGQTAIVTTTGVPYLVTGVDSMSLSAEKIPVNQSCIAKRSMVAIGGAVIYASPDGLVLIENGVASIITEGYLSKNDWLAYNPTSIKAAEYEGRYCAFFTKSDSTKGCLVFDFNSKSLVEISVGADAVYSDKSTDTMYVLDSTSIKDFFPTSGTNLQMIWKSKRFILPAFASFAWLVVDANFGSVTVNIYANGSLFRSRTLTSNAPVRLPPGRHKDWQIEIVSNVVVTRVTIASSSAELKQVP